MELQDLPPDTVVGRLGSNIPGPAQSITFDALGSALGVNSSPNVFNVKNYGATGNGVTDDTSAINSAIAAFNTAGAGRLYFPAGQYLCSGALTAITATGIVAGDGHSNNKLSSQILANSATAIICSSQSAALFTVNALALTFMDMTIFNSYSGTPSSTSAGIVVTNSASNFGQCVNYYRITVFGFYINVDVQVGSAWVMEGCNIWGPVEYGVHIQNTVNTDAGDWCISNSVIQSGAYTAPAGVKQSGSGGGKIVNTKFNTDGGATNAFTDSYNGDLTSTADLLISNCSFEAFANTAITIANAKRVLITGNQITGGFNSSPPTNHALIIAGTSVTDMIITGNLGSSSVSGTNYIFDATGAAFNISFGPNYAGDNITGLFNQSNVGGTFSVATGLVNSELAPPVNLSALGSAGFAGRRAFINNANSTTLGSVAAGGGSNVVPVFDDGSNWRLG